ncbi:hypothetical protein NLJ89_g5702 [Agrocybe chaxingu]|uniref:Uncharacterized protein n=1 Tax=Agrocybe chaxingu TaxID=84603 RepID=A0A9W8JZQ1_9AGAR|nr:hypothetical protein NLJ89_g5702 [Agrocybe chaxingu]
MVNMSVTIDDRGSTSSSPRLPLELERDIFEIAAYQDLGSAYQLLFVAKRVYQWIEPMVYRVLLRFTTKPTRLRSSLRSCPLLDQCQTDQEPSPRLKQVSSYTTHLMVQDVHANVANEILKLHSRVQDLALWAISGSHRQLAHTLTTLRLQRLSTSLDKLLLQDDGLQFDPTLFPYLTHLDIVDAGEYRDRVFSKLHLLPRLSHFAWSTVFFVISSDIEEAIKTLLRDSLTLKLLILCPTMQFCFERF